MSGVFAGTAACGRRSVRHGERPRLVVYRSLNNIEGQVVDDTQGVTLLGISTHTASDVKAERRS
jgi:ribosomal protein L18